jgi:hypothetical protein
MLIKIIFKYGLGVIFILFLIISVYFLFNGGDIKKYINFTFVSLNILIAIYSLIVVLNYIINDIKKMKNFLKIKKVKK